MCLTHSEAKQTKTSEFRAEKVFLQGQARECVACAQKTGTLLWAKFGMRATGCVAFFQLSGGELTGWCFRNLVLNLKLPSSAWVPAEELKNFVRYIPSEGTRTLSLHYCFLTSPPLFLHSLSSRINNCLNLPFGTHARSRRLKEAYFLQTKNRGYGKD